MEPSQIYFRHHLFSLSLPSGFSVFSGTNIFTLILFRFERPKAHISERNNVLLTQQKAPRTSAKLPEGLHILDDIIVALNTAEFCKWSGRKCKAIPVTGRAGPWGRETSRLHIFWTVGSQMAVTLSAVGGRPHFTPGRFMVLISVRGWVDPRLIMRLHVNRKFDRRLMRSPCCLCVCEFPSSNVWVVEAV
jgi:hypothetical protein